MPVTKRRKNFIDHEGNKFNSIEEMCNYWNISIGTYNDRHRKKWSTKECLLGRLPIVDPNGVRYKNQADMCKAWNVKLNTYVNRINRGYTQIEALTGNKEDIKSFQVQDHLGNIYTSIEDICKAYGITPTMWYQRLKKGWSIEKTLTTKPRVVTKHKMESIEERTDHNGIVYTSIKEMCNHFDIEYLTYIRRIERGWTKQQALTEGINNSHGTETTDPFGKTYPMLKDMLDAYSIGFSTYNQRTKNGYSLLEALGVIPLLNNSIKDFVIDNNLTVIENIEENNKDAKLFFLCMFKGHEIVMHRNAIINYYISSHKGC